MIRIQLGSGGGITGSGSGSGNGAGGVSAGKGAGAGKGFKKGGFKVVGAAQDPVGVIDESANGKENELVAGSIDDDDDIGYELYDPRFPTGCGMDCGSRR